MLDRMNLKSLVRDLENDSLSQLYQVMIKDIMSRILVITADDFGYCEARNRGILEAFKCRAITRTSLLVNASCCREAAALAKEHQIPLGLHLNLTEGRPVSPTDEIRSLLTEDSLFKGKIGFRSSLAEGNINLQEVRLEIRAQLYQFKALTGHLPLYVDGHQHIHVLAGICEVFAEVLEESCVLSTRLPIELGIEDCGWIPKPRKDFYTSVVNDAKNAVTMFRRHGLRFGNGFVGMATMGQDMSRQTLEGALYTAFFIQDKSSVSNLGAGNPMLNCDKQTVNSTTCRPQPGAVSPCDAEVVPDGTAAGTVSVKTANSSEQSQTRVIEETVPRGALDCSSLAQHCDTALSAGSKDTDNIVPQVLPPSALSVEVELMTHPGYPCVDGQGGCGEGPDDFARSSDRLHELNVLKSPWLLAFYKANSIQLCQDFSCGHLLL